MMRKILVIEDDKGVRCALKLAFELESLVADFASDGSEGLQRLREDPSYAVILLDLMMPIMDGWQFLALKEQSPAIAKIPVLVLSALDPKCLLPGVQGYVPKPFDIETLTDRARAYCSEPALADPAEPVEVGASLTGA